MEQALILLLVLIVVFLSFLLFKKNQTKEDTSLIIQQFNQFDNKIQTQYEQNVKIVRDITEKLTNLERTNKQVMGFSEQLNSLEKVLTSQKQRGNLGELGLQVVLENILPPSAFSLQYSFEDGDRVDAVIHTKDGMIPVDAKFSLENYQKIINEKDKEKRERLGKEFKNDLKKRIDETAKYIKPKYGTLDFAFMFIPAEGIYYDLLINEVGAIKENTKNLINYAFNDRKVIIVSPTTFSAYLLTVLYGLRAFRIEESAKSIRKNVEMLGSHIKNHEMFMKKLGASMGIAVGHYNAAYKELVKMDKDVVRITDGESKIKVEEIEETEKPIIDSD